MLVLNEMGMSSANADLLKRAANKVIAVGSILSINAEMPATQ